MSDPTYTYLSFHKTFLHKIKLNNMKSSNTL